MLLFLLLKTAEQTKISFPFFCGSSIYFPPQGGKLKEETSANTTHALKDFFLRAFYNDNVGNSRQYTVGIDEVGRGPLAGPVLVCVLALPEKLRLKNPAPLRDSKRLSESERALWFQYIKARPKILYATARAYPRTIDRVNIRKATNIAAIRALSRLALQFKRANRSIGTVRILTDAGLDISLNELPASLAGKVVSLKSFIQGDEKFTSVKLASIVAKVSRDRYMIKQSGKYPDYSFNNHKGYGTLAHIKALKRYGVCPIHRLTFLGKINTMKRER